MMKPASIPWLHVIPEPISSDPSQSMENQPFPTLSVISDRSELSGIGIMPRLAALALAGLAACLITGRAAASMETGDLMALRGAALELLNQDRRERTLPPRELDAILNEAAQKHAEDMLRRGYYSHRSPEGETGMDRYRAAGGGTSQVVAENVARCEG